MEFLEHIFGLVCGQNTAHTWSPGGALLPLCQRCTGLYSGAFSAFLLLWLFRPAVNRRFRSVHACFLIAMIPLGLHWVPQGAFLRVISGFLFGAAVVVFLILPAVASWRESRRAIAGYAFGMMLAFLTIWTAGAYGDRTAARLISIISIGGTVVILITLAINFAIQVRATRICRDGTMG